jgi:hypothetical protein
MASGKISRRRVVRLSGITHGEFAISLIKPNLTLTQAAGAIA